MPSYCLLLALQLLFHALHLPAPYPTIASPCPTIASPCPTIASPCPTIASPGPTIASPCPTIASAFPPFVSFYLPLILRLISCINKILIPTKRGICPIFYAFIMMPEIRVLVSYYEWLLVLKRTGGFSRMGSLEVHTLTGSKTGLGDEIYLHDCFRI